MGTSLGQGMGQGQVDHRPMGRTQDQAQCGQRGSDSLGMAGQGNGDRKSQGSSGRAQPDPCPKAVPERKGRAQRLLNRAAWGSCLPGSFQLSLGKLQCCLHFSKSSLFSVPVLEWTAKRRHSRPSPHAMEAALISEPCMSSAYCTGSP